MRYHTFGESMPRSFNPKRQMRADSDTSIDRDALAKCVRYGGNPEHKRNPGDFGLTPPATPRIDKTLCDGVAIFQRQDALKLLREGIRRGLISQQERNHFPQNIWAVSDNGTPLEAQLENEGTGAYHGYPMPADDAFSEVVLQRWK